MKTRKLKPKKITIILFIMFVITLLIGVGYGSYLLITKKNYNDKIRKLENELSANLKVIEEKNVEYNNKLLEEETRINQEIEAMSNNEEAIKEELRNLSIVGVGDSVFLDVIENLKEVMPNGYYNGKISRTLAQGLDILSDLKNQGKLSDTIVLGLANNGYFSEKTSQKLMEIVEDRTLYWINTVGPDDPNFNSNFSEFAKNYPNIHIIDWVTTSNGHPEYFYPDGTHIKGTGVTAYANMIYETIYNDYKKVYESKLEELKKEELSKINNKLVFYGDDLLISSYTKINEKYEDILLNTKQNYGFEEIYKDIEEKIEKQSLGNKVVFLFDKKIDVSLSQYTRLVELCKDYQIYICDISGKVLNLTGDNVKVIDFYDTINKNKDYLEFDDIHLTDEGVNALVETLSQNIEL